MPNPLRIGPMKPDEVASSSQGTRTDALSMIQAVQAAYPPELRAVLQRAPDPAGSAVLDLEALSSEYGTKVVAAGVYGSGPEAAIAYIFEDESGRTGRWYAPLKGSGSEALVADAHDEQNQEAERTMQEGWKPPEGAPETPEPPAPEAPPASEPPAPEPEPLQPEPETEPAAAESDDPCEPWLGYDNETVAEVQAKVDDLDEGQRAQVREYEAAHKNRKGVLDALNGG